MTCPDKKIIPNDACWEPEYGCPPDLLTAPFFWGMNLFVSLAIIFGPSLLAALGII